MERLWTWLRFLMLGEVERCLGRELCLDRLSMLDDLCRERRSSLLIWNQRTISSDFKDLL